MKFKQKYKLLTILVKIYEYGTNTLLFSNFRTEQYCSRAVKGELIEYLIKIFNEHPKLLGLTREYPS